MYVRNRRIGAEGYGSNIKSSSSSTIPLEIGPHAVNPCPSTPGAQRSNRAADSNQRRRWSVWTCGRRLLDFFPPG